VYAPCGSALRLIRVQLLIYVLCGVDNQIHRERIQREMIDTERAYVANLNLCTQLFYTPLKEMADRDEIKSSDVSTLFMNLGTRYQHANRTHVM